MHRPQGNEQPSRGQVSSYQMPDANDAQNDRNVKEVHTDNK